MFTTISSRILSILVAAFRKKDSVWSDSVVKLVPAVLMDTCCALGTQGQVARAHSLTTRFLH